MEMVRYACSCLHKGGMSRLTPHSNLARDITASEHAEAVRRLEVYREWFLETIMNSRSHNTLILLPIADAQPRYRDDPPGYMSPRSTREFRFVLTYSRSFF